MKHFLAALLRYVTNHIICHIPFYTIRHGWYRHILGWSIGPHTVILMGQRVQMGGIRSDGKKTIIGDDTVINADCLLYTTGGLIIGSHVSVSAGVWLVTGTHDINHPQFPDNYKPIVIEDYVWIGMRATILGGVTLGKGCVVMAGAVVSRDVPPFSVVGGVPARIIRQRELQAPNYTLDFHPLFE